MSAQGWSEPLPAGNTTDEQARLMTAAQLILCGPVFNRHSLTTLEANASSWIIEPVNAEAREILRRLQLWETRNALC